MRAVIQSRVRTARWSSSSRQADSTSFKAENRSAKAECGIDTREVVRVDTGRCWLERKNGYIQKGLYRDYHAEKERKIVIYDARVVARKKVVDYRGLEKRQCICADSMMKEWRKASASSHD